MQPQPDFREVAESIGLRLRSILDDDRIHRCATELHPKKQNGTYRTDGTRGWVKNWESGETAIWHAAREVRRTAPLAPLPSLAARRAEEAARAEWAAKVAQRKIAMATAQTHPYLERKGFPKALGLVHEGLLLVPARINDRAVSLQEIAEDGTKKNLPGGTMRGASFSIGSGRDEVLCEGYATGLSIKAALAGLHLPARVTCCFSASNVATVAERRRHAVVVADNDKPVAQFGGLGTGEYYARRTGLPWAMPPAVGDGCQRFPHERRIARFAGAAVGSPAKEGQPILRRCPPVLPAGRAGADHCRREGQARPGPVPLRQARELWLRVEPSLDNE
jgi:putative DNA primase/helicase